MSMLSVNVEKYLSYLEKERRVTAATLRNYGSTLHAFARHHASLNPGTVRRFLREYEHSSTANTLLVRLKGFAEFLDVPLDKVPRAKEIVKDPEAMSSAEVKNLVKVCRTIDPQLALSVCFLSETGLRIHEFFALRRQSLSVRHGIPHIKVFGKGQKYRDVPLSDAALEAFSGLELPFTIPEKRYRALLAAAGEQAQLPFHLNPHKLRSSFASIHLNERGTNVAHLCKIGGWTKSDTLVQRYYKPDLRTLHKAV